jgi:hypothetical protein
VTPLIEMLNWNDGSRWMVFGCWMQEGKAQGKVLNPRPREPGTRTAYIYRELALRVYI